MDNTGPGVFGELGILDGGEAEAFGAVGAPYGTENSSLGRVKREYSEGYSVR